MPIKVGKSYTCSYCGKVYHQATAADMCRDSHDLVYVQLGRDDLMRLIQFIYLKDDDLITPNLIRRLKRYLRVKTSTDEDKDLSSM